MQELKDISKRSARNMKIKDLKRLQEHIDIYLEGAEGSKYDHLISSFKLNKDIFDIMVKNQKNGAERRK